MNDSKEKLVCPKCQSKNVARVLFGLPNYNEDLDRKLKNKEVVLGGCVLDVGAPDYHCNECGEEWERLRS